MLAVTLAVTEGFIVSTACIICIIISPFAVYQKTKLKNLGDMRTQQDALRVQVNKFSHENAKLSGHLDTFESVLEQ